MRFMKFAVALSLVALTATPTYAARHRVKRHSHSVNGASSIQPPNGNRKATRTGGPAGGQTTE